MQPLQEGMFLVAAWLDDFKLHLRLHSPILSVSWIHGDCWVKSQMEF
jgi:hypothetical protein